MSGMEPLVVYIEGGLVQYTSEPAEVIDYDIEGAAPGEYCTCRLWEIDRDHYHTSG